MFSLSRIIGNTPIGTFQPTDIEIVGAFTCPGSNGGVPVELRLLAPSGVPTTIFATTTSLGGAGNLPVESFSILVPWTGFHCGERIEFEVRGDCGVGWTNWLPYLGDINCYCPRIGNLRTLYGACRGTPQRQEVEITATVMLNPGPGTTTFNCDYGDGVIDSYSVPNPTNFNTQQAITFTHDFDVAGGPYTAHLYAGECPKFDFTVRPGCVACCDEVTITIDSQPLPCLPFEGGTVSVQFSAALSPTGCSGPFEWKVTNVATGSVIQQFTIGGSTFSYPFTSAGQYKVNVRVKQDNTCDDPFLTDSVTFAIFPCSPCAVGLSGPQQTSCTDGAPTLPQTYTATTTIPFAGPYSWEVVKSPATLPFYQSQGGSSLTFPFPGPGTYTVSVSLQTQGCTNPTASDSMTVIVPSCPCPSGQHRDASGNCVPDPDPPPSRMSCDALLWIALILIGISGVLAVIGCIISKSYPYAAIVLGIIAIVLLVIGLVLFLLWWAICRFFTLCSAIIAAMNFMGILISVFFVIGVVLGLIAKLGGQTDMYLCMGVSFFQSGIWGLLLYILYRIAIGVGCVTENPNGPKPPSYSSNSLSSYGGMFMGVQISQNPAPYRIGGQVGLGDIVKLATGAMGIEPCQKCHERAARLNEWMLFGGRRIENSGRGSVAKNTGVR